MNMTKGTEYEGTEIGRLLEATHANSVSHGLDHRCPTCNAGKGKWCIGTDALAGPTDRHPSHQSRLALIAR